MGSHGPTSTASVVASEPMDRIAAGDVGARADTRDAAGWQSLVSTLFDWRPHPFHPPRTEGDTLTVHHFGFFLVCHATGLVGRFRRTPIRLNLDDLDHLVVTIPLQGSIGFRGPQPRLLRPGDVAIIDLRTELAFSMEPGEAIHLILPRMFLPASVAPPAVSTLRLLRGEKLAARFLIDLAQMLIRMPAYANRAEASALAAVLRTPLAFCLAAADGEPTGRDTQRRGRDVRRFIEDHLDDPDLVPAKIATRFGLSRSQLFRQFDSAGGVETYIRRRRLRRTLVDLSDPTLLNRSIGEIAYAAGFADEAHFSRMFKTTYGTTPRAFRKGAGTKGPAARGQSGAGAPPPADRLLTWLEQLRDT
ncbi:helix-turn-helix domain-containing protein [Affinirhizobium pseudoryzae]|uniref:helix-turn-helix domain-containing protein n=1 Tax=Allorhizobium pseudoryzae TaxID=379684 RepID=UPI0013EE1C35|nr:helix-turn-helix domain-containing protein [Allorhizobium pseudoryzae]